METAMVFGKGAEMKYTTAACNAELTLNRVVEDLMTMFKGVTSGCYEFLATCGPATAADLAVATGWAIGYTSTWLAEMSESGIVEVEEGRGAAEHRRYRLSTGRQQLLVDIENPLDSMTVAA